MTYQPIPSEVAGGQKRVWISDDETRSLLDMILTELKIMNLHLAEMSDQQFDVSDVHQ